MITVEEATQIVFEHLFSPATTTREVTEAVGCVLAESVQTDRDFPPFNRVLMDGIAFSYVQWIEGRRSFAIAGTQAAGQPQEALSNPAHCMEVMTGAVLPEGCDTVVRYEDVEISDGTAVVKTDAVQPWQNVGFRGTDAKANDVVLQRGQKLAPSEIALLASVGKKKVSVLEMPRFAIVSTGDELVDVEDSPRPWQIRRSNSYAIQAALREMGAVSKCFHLNDELSAMGEALGGILRDHDVLILSGGVSKGKFDFVPSVMEKLGVHALFHQVSQRPGKPFWFGASASGKIAFALPGNPVSTFMCFYRYVKPWLLRSLGVPAEGSTAVLAKDYSFPPALTYFLQVSVRNERGVLMATPVPGGGSGDFANLTRVDGFLELPSMRSEFRAGEVYPFFAFRH